MLYQGLEYIQISKAQSIPQKIVERKFGLTGFAVLVKLEIAIECSEGYYCQWDEDSQNLFAYENDIEIEKLKDIVKLAISKGIFDEAKYNEYQILTSQEIQEHFVKAVKGRNEITIHKAYLISEDTIQKTKAKSCYLILEDGSTKKYSLKESAPKKDENGGGSL